MAHKTQTPRTPLTQVRLRLSRDLYEDYVRRRPTGIPVDDLRPGLCTLSIPAFLAVMQDAEYAMGDDTPLSDAFAALQRRGYRYYARIFGGRST